MLGRAALIVTAALVAIASAPAAGADSADRPGPTTLPGEGRESVPPDSGVIAPPPSDDVVNAVVVQSYSQCTSDNVLWKTINKAWSDYGTTEIHIDFSYRPLCDHEVTYDKLVASGADVVILSDVCGAGVKLSKQEKAALSDYLGDGHGLYASFLLLRVKKYTNRSLSPLVGVNAPIRDSSVNVEPTYDVLEPESPLFAAIGDPYVSSGYAGSQAPNDRSWDPDDLTDTARYVATTTDDRDAIIVNEASTFRAVYVTSMPEFFGGPVDEQFVYNAITYVAPEVDARPAR